MSVSEAKCLKVSSTAVADLKTASFILNAVVHVLYAKTLNMTIIMMMYVCIVLCVIEALIKDHTFGRLRCLLSLRTLLRSLQ